MRILFALFLVSLFSCTARQPTGAVLSPSTKQERVADYQAVYTAINDYVEAIYAVKPELIARSVDTELKKIGYYFNEEKESYRDNLPMTYDQLYSLAGKWNSEGDMANEDSPREIEVFEVNDKTAVGKLTATWGIDYFQLAKVGGSWKIKHIIWQSAPRN
ncbi:hypothetical protein CEQ90_13095 [Lewinellaceae bacterium SD302]|nr:hypothetical protein CEQ90_13095 [Lewinellaceae bacterium SD302]